MTAIRGFLGSLNRCPKCTRHYLMSPISRHDQFISREDAVARVLAGESLGEDYLCSKCAELGGREATQRIMRDWAGIINKE